MLTLKDGSFLEMQNQIWLKRSHLLALNFRTTFLGSITLYRKSLGRVLIVYGLSRLFRLKQLNSLYYPMRTILIILALLASCCTHAYSNEECDILASLEADPSSVSSPVAFNDIHPREVIGACSRAIARNDEEPRFLVHRARGYLKVGDGDKALSDLKQAHQLGYPAATFGLATAYYLGDDISQDFNKARELFIWKWQ